MKRLLILFFLLGLALAANGAHATPIDLGERFPDLPLEAPRTPQARHYLGLPEGASFRLGNIPAEVVLVEVLNVLCPHCQKQTGPYNQLFRRIEDDPQTRGKIKMLGIAVGNTQAQIDDFVTVYDVAYPIIADRDFSLHMAIRGGPTPLSLYVRLDGPGKPGMVAGSHLGEDRDMESLFAYLKELVTMRAADFEGLADPPQPVFPPVLHMAEPRLLDRIRQGYAKLGPTTELRRLERDTPERVYVATVNGEKIYAAVVSRWAICDVCHNVHFIIYFTEDGDLKGFEPLHLTRYGNELWDDKEVEQMRRRLVGGRLGQGWAFNPEVDAVTSATMTSAIIFDSLRRGSSLLEAIQAAKPRTSR